MLLEVRDLNVFYGRIQAIKGLVVRRRRRRDRHPHRRQRRRQDHHAEDHLRRAPGGQRAASGSRARTSPACRPTSGSSWASARRPKGRGIFPGMSRAGEPRDGLLRSARTARAGTKQQDLERVFALFPRLAGAPDAAGRHPVGRRAADAGHRPGPHVPAPGAAARRAVDGPGTHAHRPDLQHHRARSTSQGTTILLVEQNASQALRLADRAYVLETGRIVKEGSGDELLHDAVGDRRLPRRLTAQLSSVARPWPPPRRRPRPTPTP